MYCLKCGRETNSEEVFCQDCLLEMQKYPVKPGTAVQLPIRREPSPLRKLPKRRSVSPEEQIRSLKRSVRILLALLVLFLTISTALAVPTIRRMMEQQVRPGQNYTSINPSTNPSTTDASGAAGG